MKLSPWFCLAVVGVVLGAAPARAIELQGFNNANPDGSLRIADPDESYFVGGEEGEPRGLNFRSPAPSVSLGAVGGPADRNEKWNPEHTRVILGPFNRGTIPSPDSAP